MTDKEKRAVAARIRRLAAKSDLSATSKTRNGDHFSRIRLWWFGNAYTNLLESPENGLDDVEAIEWLTADD